MQNMLMTTSSSQLVSHLLHAANEMLQDDAYGEVMVIAPDCKVRTLSLDEISELTGNRNTTTLYERLCEEGTFIFDGGNAHGDAWKHVFYPRQLVHTFVCEASEAMNQGQRSNASSLPDQELF